MSKLEQTPLPAQLDAYKPPIASGSWTYVIVLNDGSPFGMAFGGTRANADSEAWELWNESARRNGTARVSARRWATIPVRDCDGVFSP